jgi:hypothetical protein
MICSNRIERTTVAARHHRPRGVQRQCAQPSTLSFVRSSHIPNGGLRAAAPVHASGCWGTRPKSLLARIWQGRMLEICRPACGSGRNMHEHRRPEADYPGQAREHPWQEVGGRVQGEKKIRREPRPTSAVFVSSDVGDT